MNNLRKSSRTWIFSLLVAAWLTGCIFSAPQATGEQGPAGVTGLSATNTIAPTIPPSPSPSPTPTLTPTPEPVWTYYRNDELHPTEDDPGLAFDQQGHLWVTGYGGVVRWDLVANTFMAYGVADGVSAALIRALIVDSGNVPWIATDEEIQSFNGQGWETVKKPTGAETRVFAEGGDGKLWLCAQDGVFSFEAGRWKQYGTQNGLIADQCFYMKIGPDGNPWVIARENSLSHFSQGWTNYEAPDDLLREEEVILFTDRGDLHVAPNGDVWVRQLLWVVHFDGMTWTLYRLPEMEGRLTAFGLSASGTPWLAQAIENKIFFRAFNGSDWPVIMAPGYETGLPAKAMFTRVVAGPDGDVWFIGHEGFIRTRQHGWTVYPRAKEYYENGFLPTVAFSADGTFYYAGSQGILALGKGPDDLQLYDSAGPLADNCIRDIQFDAQGTMWVWEGKETDFGVFGSLQRFDGRGFETLADLQINEYLVARDGAVWVRRFNQFGWEWWDGVEWHGFGDDVWDLREAGLSWMRGSGNLTQDDQGQMWVSFKYDKQHGVAVFDGQEWQTWYLPWPVPRISGGYRLGFAPDGLLWLASARFEASALSNDAEREWRRFPIPDELVDEWINDASYHDLPPLQFNNLNQPILLYVDRRDKRPPALFELRDFAWTHVPLQTRVQTILYHHDTFWVGTAGSGLYYRQDGQTETGGWVSLGSGDWPGGSQVSLVAAGRGEDVWVVTETGLARFDGAEWHAYPSETHPIGDVATIRVAPDGTVWFGSTTQGLASYWSP